MRLKSVKAKTYVLFLPVVLLLFAAVVTASYLNARGEIAAQSEYGMTGQLEKIAGSIENKLVSHSRLPETVSKTITDTYGKLTLADYQSMFTHGLEVNADTFGLGIFFENGAYKANEKYFSTYAYRDSGGIKTTEDYSDPSYDYLSQDWYKVAVGQPGTVYTPPYYDANTDVTMITAAVPVYNPQKKFIGVATGDIDLSTLQKTIADMKIGNTGWSFLLTEDGTYMAGPDKDKIMKAKLPEDPDKGLADLGKAMLQNKSGSSEYKGGSGTNRVFYQEIPETRWILAVVMPEKEMLQPVQDLLVKISLIGLAGIILVLVLIWVYSHWITRQISRIKALSQTLAAGDFTHQIDVSTSDEFGQMAEHFNRTTAVLRETITEVTRHSEFVNATSSDLSASAGQTGKVAEHISTHIQEVAAGADAQLQGTEESARAMEELSAGILRIAESSAAVRESSIATTGQAEKGNTLIQEAIAEIIQVNGHVKETAGVIRQLNQRSQEISEIVQAITDISSQTNILSLNAGIEAARAGTQGQSFAVVAQEIRKLADQSRQAAEQVRSLITEIQEYSRTAAQTAETGAAEMAKGAERVEQAGEAFHAILSHIRSTDEQIQEVSAAAEEMSASSEQVNAAVQHLSGIAKTASGNAQNVAAASQEQLASMEEIASSAEGLKHMVDELSGLLSKFTV